MLLVAYVALIPVVFALSAWVLLPSLTLPLAARLARTVRAARRRPDAERGARAHRHAAARCSACCCRRASLRAELHADDGRRCARRCGRANGELRERPLLLLELDDAAGARPRRWSPTTASRPSAAGPRSRPTCRSSATGTRRSRACAWSTPAAQADPLPQALAAVDMALWDRAGRRAGKPVCELLDGRARGVRARQCARRHGRRGARRPVARRLLLREGEGGPGGRRRAAGRDPRRDRAGRGAAHRRQRRLDRGRGDRAAGGARAAAASSSPRSPCHGVDGAARAARAHGGAAGDGRDRRARRAGARAPSASASRSRAPAASARCSRKAAFCPAVGEEVYLASTLDGPLGIAAARPLRGRAADRRGRAGWRRSTGSTGIDAGPLAPAAGRRRATRARARRNSGAAAAVGLWTPGLTGSTSHSRRRALLLGV